MNDLDALRHLLAIAVRDRRLLHVHYRCYSRLVEPWALAADRDANDVLIAWQISGGSASGIPVGWKEIRLRDLGGATLLSECFEPIGHKPPARARPGQAADERPPAPGISA